MYNNVCCYQIDKIKLEERPVVDLLALSCLPMLLTHALVLRMPKLTKVKRRAHAQGMLESV